MTTRAEIEAILAMHPALHSDGYGVKRGLHGRLSAADREAQRRALLTDESIAIIDHARAWIEQHFQPIATINENRTSYTLKNVYEYHVATTGQGIRVTNGQFIVALLLCGYRMGAPPEYNPSFNVSEKSVKRTPVSA